MKKIKKNTFYIRFFRTTKIISNAKADHINYNTRKTQKIIKEERKT